MTSTELKRKYADFFYEPNEIEWLKMYELAEKFFMENEHLMIPVSYTIKEDDNVIKLGAWLRGQRVIYANGNMPYYREEMLEAIDIIWKIKGNEEAILASWQEYYKYAKKYYEKKGNLLIPYSYKIQTENGKILNLGHWISNQRNAYFNKGTSKISKKQISLLEKIGMVWDVKNYKKTIKYIDGEFSMYQIGLLDKRYVDDLLDKGVFRYNKNHITKGDAVILSRIKKD